MRTGLTARGATSNPLVEARSVTNDDSSLKQEGMRRSRSLVMSPALNRIPVSPNQFQQRLIRGHAVGRDGFEPP